MPWQRECFKRILNEQCAILPVMRRRGVIVPICLFFGMLVLLITTIMGARVEQDLSITKYEEAETRHALAARGAAAKALACLNLDDDWKEHDKSDPVRFTETPLITEGWAEPDTDNLLIFHVYGRAYPEGKPEESEISTRVVIRRPDNEGSAFTSSPIDGKFQPDSLYYKRRFDAEWTLLPPVRAQEFDDNGQLVVDEDNYAGFVTNLTSDNTGGLYGVTFPGYDRVAAMRAAVRRHLARGEFSELWDAIGTRTDTLGTSLRKLVFGGAVIVKYDTTNQEWSALPPPPDIDFSNGIGALQLGEVYDGGLGAIRVGQDNKLYVSLHKEGQDGLLTLDLNSVSNTPNWESIPPPAKRYYDAGDLKTGPGTMEICANAVANGQGAVYCLWRNRGDAGNSLFRRDRDSWQAIPYPKKGRFDSQGAWVEGRESVAKLAHLDVNKDGNLVALWNPKDQQDSQHDYVVFEHKAQEDGSFAWVQLPPSPRFQFDANDQAVEQPGKFQAAKAVSADSEGRVLVSLDGEGRADDALCYSDHDEVELLPRLPGKFHDRSGEVREDETHRPVPLQVSGGGVENGQTDRYIPVYRY